VTRRAAAFPFIIPHSSLSTSSPVTFKKAPKAKGKRAEEADLFETPAGEE
jgi:hypothetical protein